MAAPLGSSAAESSIHLFVCYVLSLSRVLLSAAPWTVAHQALLSMGFPKQEY